MACKDNKDGSCSVEYVPLTPGLYDVNITYGGEHIPGERSEIYQSRIATWTFLKSFLFLCVSPKKTWRRRLMMESFGLMF